MSLLVAGSVAGSQFAWGGTAQTFGSPHFFFPETGMTAVYDPAMQRVWLFGGDWQNGSLDQNIYWFEPGLSKAFIPGAMPGPGPLNEPATLSVGARGYGLNDPANIYTVEEAPVLPEYSFVNGNSGPWPATGQPEPATCGDVGPRWNMGGRTDAGSSYDGQMAFIFGGRGHGCYKGTGSKSSGAECQAINDDRYYLDRIEWFNPRGTTNKGDTIVGTVEDANGDALSLPAPRSEIQATYDGTQTLLVGGQQQHQSLVEFNGQAFSIPDCPGWDGTRGMLSDDLLAFKGPGLGSNNMPRSSGAKLVPVGKTIWPVAEGGAAFFGPTGYTYYFGGTHQAIASGMTVPYHSSLVLGGSQGDCIYYHHGPWLTVRTGDIRVVTCSDGDAGSIVWDNDPDVGFTFGTSIEAPVFLYADKDGTASYTYGDDLYVSDATQTQVNTPVAPSFLVRLTTTSGGAAGTYVQPTDADQATPLLVAADMGLMWVDGDANGGLGQPAYNAANYVGTWSSAAKYLTGAIVTRAGHRYTSLYGSPGTENINNDPLNAANPPLWQVIREPDSLFAGNPMSVPGVLATATVRLGGTWGPYGHATSNLDLASGAFLDPLPPTQALFMYSPRSGPGTDCVYMHPGTGTGVQVGDLRLTDCDSYVAGTFVATSDTDAGALAVLVADARLAYRDVDADGAYTIGQPALPPPLPDNGNTNPKDPLYLVVGQGGFPGTLGASTGVTQFAIRLASPAGAPGTFVLPGDSDVGAMLHAPDNGAAFRYFDADGSRSLTPNDGVYVGAPMFQLRQQLLNQDIRLAGPYGPFGGRVDGTPDAFPSNFGEASASIMAVRAGQTSQLMSAHFLQTNTVSGVTTWSPRNNTLAVSDGKDFIYVIGGEGPDGKVLDEVWRYAPKTGSLVKMDLKLPEPRREAAGVMVGLCDAYVFGGSSVAQRGPFAASPTPWKKPDPQQVPTHDPRSPFLDQGNPQSWGNNFTGYLYSIVRLRVCGITMNPLPDVPLLVGQTWKVCPTADNPSNDVLSFTFANVPAGAFITDDHCLIWTPTEADRGATYCVTAGVHGDNSGDQYQFCYDVAKFGSFDAHNADTDRDGVEDFSDNCPGVPNSNQLDADRNGIGDACQKFLVTRPGVSVGQANGAAADYDQDGVPDTQDNCMLVVNADQADLDHDHIGDACDRDLDGDGIVDKVAPGDDKAQVDNCPTVPNQFQEDSNGNGVGDACESLAGGGTGPGLQGQPAPSGELVGTPDKKDPSQVTTMLVGGGILFVVILGAVLWAGLRKRPDNPE